MVSSPSLKVFYFYSNWKWTGPAEPALQLAHHLALLGVEVHLFAGEAPTGLASQVRQRAKSMAFHLREELSLPKHGHLQPMAKDYWTLTHLIRRERPHLLHVNLLNDHWLAWLARAKQIPILRSVYDRSPFSLKLRNQILFRLPRQKIWTIGRAWQQKLESHFPSLRGKVYTGEVAVDLERFSPHRPLPDMRQKWGFSKQHLLLGLVARIQRHRRFPLLLQGFRQLVQEFPHLRLVLIGRGTHMDEVARRPVQELGLEQVVYFAGYLQGDEYVGALKALDIKLLMVAGSDASARAVREAMAMGKPLLVGRDTVLPELIQRSEAGEVFDYTLESFLEKARRLLHSPRYRQKCAENSRKYALHHFSPTHWAEQMFSLYERLVNPSFS